MDHRSGRSRLQANELCLSSVGTSLAASCQAQRPL